jgi:DNA-binding GntR family transcriptional regulator
MGLQNLSGINQRKSLGQHVFEHLKKAVIEGHIAAGDRIIESRLAETLGISRTPVREAIHKLEREGYLEKLPRGGFSVLGLSREAVEETFGIRGVLESYAARLAAVKHKQKELEPLEKKIKIYQENLDKKNLDALPKINTEFHDLLYALSRSPILIKMIHDLRDQIYRYRQLILKEETFAKMSNDDHKQMLRYIRRRDADGAEAIVRDHLVRGRKAVLRLFDDQETSYGSKKD